MSKEADEAGEAILKFFGVVTVTIGMSLLRAATIVFFWAWYVVPVFHFPVLTLWRAYGCTLLVSMFTAPGLNEKQTPPFGTLILRSLVWLGMAWALAGILNLLK